MAHAFDPGYGAAPWRELVAAYPGEETYPRADFRTEWGPIFHRGRLDGSARILVIGQDPGQHETFIRRILVGEAGQRAQGFLAKLGIERSYVMINAFLYSVFGQSGGEKHRSDPAIAAYRNTWLDALFANNAFDAVVTFGSLADAAWDAWRSTPGGARGADVAYRHLTHPTQPESSSKGDAAKLAQATKALLTGWNKALEALAPRVRPDTPRALTLYGDTFAPGDLVEVPEADLPPGLPAWMRGLDTWAARTGTTAKERRATLAITVPATELP